MLRVGVQLDALARRSFEARQHREHRAADRRRHRLFGHLPHRGRRRYGAVQLHRPERRLGAELIGDPLHDGRERHLAGVLEGAEQAGEQPRRARGMRLDQLGAHLVRHRAGTRAAQQRHGSTDRREVLDHRVEHR